MSSNNSFVFYDSWSSFIDLQEREKAKEIVYQIYRVGLDKEIDTDDKEIISIINSFILPNIKGAKRRYKTAVENGNKSKGRPRATSAEDDERIYQLHKEGWTYAQIAEEFDIDKNTVGDRVRTLKKEEELKTKNQNEKPNTETKTKNKIETFINKNKNISNKDTDNEEEIDSNNLPLHYNFTDK